MKKLMATAMLMALSFAAFSSASSYTIEQIRENYVAALENEKLTKVMLDYFEGLEEKTPLLVGYEGAFEALMAKHAWNPYSKLAHLKKSLNILEKAVERSPDQIEVRFLRFSLMHYLPNFLRNDNIFKEDRKTICGIISKKEEEAASVDVLQVIANFMLESNRCTVAEQDNLRKLLQSMS